MSNISKFVMSIVLFAIMFGTTGCWSRIDAGYEGVKFNKLGGDKGICQDAFPPGYYWLWWNEEMHEYPVYLSQYPFTADLREGSETNEEMSFQTKEGLSISCDVSVMAQVVPNKSPLVFQKFRRDFPIILKTFFFQELRTSFNKYASNMSVEEIYGSGRNKLLDNITKDIKEKGTEWNIQIDQISYLSNIRVPKSVEDSINLKVVATQEAQRRENEIQTTKAEASKKIEEAKGLAQKRIEEARGESESIAITGAALRQNPEVLELRKLQIAQDAISKWSGILPTTLMCNSTGKDMSVILPLENDKKK